MIEMDAGRRTACSGVKLGTPPAAAPAAALVVLLGTSTCYKLKCYECCDVT
jgi:hypothetical protein